MARLSSELKQAAVLWLAQEAAAKGRLLIEQIGVFAASAFSQIQTGAAMVSGAGAGYTASWSAPSGTAMAGLTPAEIPALAAELRKLCTSVTYFLAVCEQNDVDPDDVDRGDPALSDLPVVIPLPTPSESDIKERMLLWLTPVTEYQHDYLWLRIPPGLQYV